MNNPPLLNEMNVALKPLETTNVLSMLSQVGADYLPSSYIPGKKTIELVAANQPLEGILHHYSPDLKDKTTIDETTWTEFSEAFLKYYFSGLTQLGVSFSLKKEEDAEVADNYIAQLEKAKMSSQARRLKALYDQYERTRQVFITMQKHDMGVLNILPEKYLADMSVVFPVWFYGKRNERRDGQFKVLLDCVPTDPFAWFIQMYNHPRWAPGLNDFDSPVDLVPPNVLEKKIDFEKLFDVMVIATLYHDIASSSWSVETQRQLADPLMFGKIEGIPFLFLLARWSGTQIFPKLGDLFAATIEHLEDNLESLVNIRGDVPWHRNRRGRGTPPP